MDNVAFMRKAKMQLNGRWNDAALGTLVYVVLMGVASMTYVAELIVFGPLTIGYLLFLGCLVDTGMSKIDLIFSLFNNRFVETMIAGILFYVIVGIGSMLLVVPGIIAATGLLFTFFIMADDRNISGLDALKMSWNMMNGHKWDLFCFNLRFIGWVILAVLTCGIGFIWLYPYIYISNYNFYRQLRYGTF